MVVDRSECGKLNSWRPKLLGANPTAKKRISALDDLNLRSEVKSIWFVVDIELRVIGLLKTVTFTGAVTKSGAETEDIAQWVNLVGSGS